MKCSDCGGEGKTRNAAFLDDVDKLMDGGNYPDYYSARKQALRWNPEYIPCAKCNGTGQVEK